MPVRPDNILKSDNSCGFRGGWGGGGVQSNPSLTQKFIFMVKFDKLGIPYLPLILTILSFFFFTTSQFYHLRMFNTAGLVENIVD